MFTWKFWKDAIERTLRTFAQTVAAVLIVGVTNLATVDWSTVLGVAGASALASLLSAIAFPPKSTAPVIATVPVTIPQTVATVGPTVTSQEG